MDEKKLDEIKKGLAAMRRSPQKPSAVERLAKRLGRKRAKRGKEPMWENQEFAQLYPLSIPRHGRGKDLAPGTQRSILNQLEEDDVAAWEERLAEEEDEGNDDDSR